MTESFFKKKEFIRLLLAKEKGLSWVIEYKPPAACLGRKDNTSVFLEKKKNVLQAFLHQVEGRKL